MKRAPGRRLLALLLAAAVVATGAASAPRRVRAAPGPTVPVVLVPGFAGGPETWDAGPGGGLRADLRRRGYEDGVSLFALPATPGPREDLLSAARRVARAAEDARARAGAGQVDLVAFGTGALAARFYAEFLSSPGEVRTLVMIAPPNRGSFAADAARVWLFSEALAPGLAGALGSELARQAVASEPDVARAEAALALAEAPSPEGELAREGRLVRELWLPLMAWFVVHRRLLPEEERPPREESFASWLRAEAPEFWSAAFSAGERPPEGREQVLAWAGSPPTAWLDPAYERLLAYQVADLGAAIAQGLADARPPVPGLGEAAGAALGGLAKGDWVSALWHAALAWVVDWAGRAARALGRPAVALAGRAAGAWAVESWLGLEAESPALALMVRETAEGAGTDVPANRLLSAWNRLAAERAAERTTAYVVLGGETLDVWRWFGTGAGANDGVVEVAATSAPEGPLDARRVVAGFAAASHFALPASPAVRQAAEGALDPFRGALALPAGEARPVAIRTGGPSLVRVGPGLARVEPEAGRGALRAFWVAADGRSARALPLEGGAWRGEIGEGYLALRLADESGPAVGRAVVAWEADAPGRDGAAGSSEDTAARGPSGSTSTPAGSEGAGGRGGSSPGGGDAPGQGGAGTPGRGPSDASGAPVGSEAGSERAGDLPLIRVVLHTRLTTDKRPKLVEHARWHWSFGDGTEADDPDPGHVGTELTHVYAQPGEYTATATSYAADGRVLRELTFPVRVTVSGEAKAFRAQSIRAPKVRLTLAGPEAWVAGRPAAFSVAADVDPTDFVQSYEVRLDPGPRFLVVWERPGDDFVVRAAATVKVRYAFPEGRSLTVYDTYVVEREVDVYATSVVD